MNPTPPAGAPGETPGGVPDYRSQYTVSPQFKKFWEHMFNNAPLTKTQLSQMTDQFVRNVWNQMNSVLQWAIKEQKKRHAEEKRQEAEG